MDQAELSDLICMLLLDISEGTCSITDEMIEAQRDEATATILTGLSLLYDDLQRQATLREEAENELRHREAHFRALFDQAKVAIIDCDVSELTSGEDIVIDSLEPARSWVKRVRVRNVNSETLRLFEADSAATFEAGFPALFTGDSVPLVQRLATALGAGTPHIDLDGVLETPGGRRVHVVLSMTTPDASNLEERHAIVTIADVTAEHQARAAAAELASAREVDVQRIASEVDRLSYAVSHDLQAPLRGVTHLAEWAVEDLHGGNLGAASTHLHMLTARIHRLDKILADLTAYSEVSRAAPDREDVVVAQLIEELTRTIAPVPDGEATPRPTVTWGPMPTLNTQAALLRAVLERLIDNAIKHHDRDDGTIRISYAPEEGGHVFAVSDDGPGVPGAFRQRIFNMLSTLKPRDVVEGSGMGLAHVHKVLTHVGGSIEVLDSPEGGATFRFFWPA